MNYTNPAIIKGKHKNWNEVKINSGQLYQQKSTSRHMIYAKILKTFFLHAF